MPKNFKMNTISRSGLPFLKSRRIKSAMKDPIRTLQKSLDKIYNHLLNELECVFVRRFNILSSSVSSATKQFREPRVVPQVHGETPLNLKEISGIYIQTATSLYWFLAYNGHVNLLNSPILLSNTSNNWSFVLWPTHI